MNTRESLLDFFDDRIRSAAPFLVYDDGYRAETRSYADVRAGAERFAGRLAAAGCRPDDKVVLWGENRPEWIAAFWGCLLVRAVVVPLDVRMSADLMARVAARVRARIVVVGDEAPAVDAAPGTVHWRLADVLAPGGAHAAPPRAAPAGGDLAEIIFTSGATADPKGVEITHANLLANIVPVEREVRKYARYGRPFYPLRFLNLLPLSHLFGQAMATFVPPMLAGVTVFMRGYNPAEILRQIRTRRVSVLVCVPRILEVLREELLRVAPETAEATAGGRKRHVAVRWWRHRRTHRLFGMKFWAFVVGGAPLDPELQDFWSRLGFLVVQGYGLTETAPMVTVNHPFRTRRGSVGKPIGGVEVAIADDGEILVRGGNVTRGYYDAPDATAEAFHDGWLRTGDVGSLDASGHLTVRGRKKEMIVTPDGLNVFPEDVERALGEVAGVREAAVVGASRDGREHVHAVLVLEAGIDADAVVRDANLRLEEHQRIRGRSVWPEAALPRTEGTRKLRRRELAGWVAGGRRAAPAERGAGDRLGAAIAEFAHGRPVTDATTLDELGLASLERIELMVALERAFDRTLDEATFAEARTVGDLRALVADGGAPGTAAAAGGAAAA
ncbi:MAG: AMP-binding protein, partial [Acidobacteria bacterium]|nr:AMP-binding protein [Acidobacteriota bacterium]